MYKKRIMAFLLSTTLMFSLIIPSHAAQFIDNPSNAWFYDYVNYASNQGWISGYGNGIFGPNDKLTKAQAITIITRAIGLEATKTTNAAWYQGFVERGILEGYVTDTSNMNDPISRYDVAEMIFLAYGLEEDESYPNIFADINEPFLNALSSNGIISGVQTEKGFEFLGNNSLTRAEMCTMLTRAHQNLRGGEPIPPKPVEEPKPVESEPPLEIEIKDKTPEVPEIKEEIVIQTNKFFLDKNIKYGTDLFSDEDAINQFMHAAANDLFEMKFTTNNLNQIAIINRVNELFTIMNYLDAMYPEYFHIYGDKTATYQQTSNSEVVVTIKCQAYGTYTKEGMVERKNKLLTEGKQLYNELVKNKIITNGMSDQEKALNIARYITENTRYDQTIHVSSHYGTNFLEGKPVVCDGYTTMYNVLLKYAGIECYGIIGIASEMHIWTICKLDGRWKMVDLTYMDPIIIGNPNANQFETTYFNITWEEMKQMTPKRYVDSGYFTFIQKFGIPIKA